MDDKNKIQAVLFAVGDMIEEQRIADLTNISSSRVKELLHELRENYHDDSPFYINNKGTLWKFTLKEKYIPLVRDIVPHTELSKTVMETLAVIAWKAPVLQSDVVHIRSNKAYGHISDLVDMGFISKTPHGRTYMLKLSERFFEYFDFKDREDVEERFQGFEDITPNDVIEDETEKTTS